MDLLVRRSRASSAGRHGLYIRLPSAEKVRYKKTSGEEEEGRDIRRYSRCFWWLLCRWSSLGG